MIKQGRRSGMASNIKLVNVCCLARIDNILNLKQLLAELKNARPVKSSKFASVVVKTEEETFLIYASGKIVSVGGKSVKSGEKAVRKLVQEFNEVCGVPCELVDFRVTNLVGSTSLGYKIRLDEMYEANRRNCTWEAELFPGLKFRYKFLGVSVTAFASGKINVLGAKTWDQIEQAAERFKRIAPRYKCRYQ